MVIRGAPRRPGGRGLFLSVDTTFSGGSEPFSQIPRLQVGRGDGK